MVAKTGFIFVSRFKECERMMFRYLCVDFQFGLVYCWYVSTS